MISLLVKPRNCKIKCEITVLSDKSIKCGKRREGSGEKKMILLAEIAKKTLGSWGKMNYSYFFMPDLPVLPDIIHMKFACKKFANSMCPPGRAV